ncbi:MAG: type II toxin-antitoxin system VapC family toxin [Chloroflexota bacterium]|nr:type II toxin-antitoxin system VapC family toxin [Chloroflexota bacterium]MDE2841732.1 type II toxin-antitoxin system VapC family toxin [Chloroflexota bacterium]MDE2931163.1 type II toxin-antitoxin system VapC family toxin [Chloroflexota bacterium]
MPYLIDSDWVIDYLGQEAEALQLVDRLAQEGIAISIVTYMEVYQGVLRSQDANAASAQFEALVAAIPVLPFSRPVAERCAQLRESLRKQGKRPQQRALDLIIAATALTYDLVLVTRNIADYQDLPGLVLYQPRR